MHHRQSIRRDGFHDVAPTGTRRDPGDPRDWVDRDLSVVKLHPEQERVTQVAERLA